MWNIRKIVHDGNYYYAVVPEHPNADEHGYVLVHRVVMENYIGRLLKEDEEVHHKNRNRYDNRPENLALVNKRDHNMYHGFCKARTMVLLRCPNCGKEFSIGRNQSFIVRKVKYNANFCSRECSGEFFSKMNKLGGLTPKMKEALNNCFIKEYKMLTPFKLNYIADPASGINNA